MGIDFTNVNIYITDIFIFAGIILAAIGAIWGIKKMVCLGSEEHADKIMNNGLSPDVWYDVNNNLHTDEGYDGEYNDSGSSSKIYGLWDTDEEFRQDLAEYTDKYIH